MLLFEYAYCTIIPCLSTISILSNILLLYLFELKCPKKLYSIKRLLELLCLLEIFNVFIVGILIRPQPIVGIKGFLIHGPAKDWTEVMVKVTSTIVCITFICTFFCIVYQFCVKYKHLCSFSCFKSLDFLSFMIAIITNILTIIGIVIFMYKCLHEVKSNEIDEKEIINYVKYENISSLRIFEFDPSGTINYHHSIYISIFLYFFYLITLIFISIGILNELGKFNYIKTSLSLLKNGSAVQTLFIEAFFSLSFLTICCIMMLLVEFWNDLHKNLWMSYLINKLLIIGWLFYTLIIPFYLIKTHFLDRYHIKLNVFRKWKRRSN
uniref:Serpentine receptor class gamma n=1 Tax=Strongyloides stercoralis TaxID=6248 RepID=A0A0K0E247_STRER